MSRNIIQSLKFGKQPVLFDAREFGKRLEQGILGGRRESKFTTKKTFSPSSIGYGHGTCARFWYLAFEGGDWVETTDAMGIANMENGSAAHDRIQAALKRTGMVKSLEEEMTLSDPPVRGFIDAVVEMDGVPVVGEIKTTRQESFLPMQLSMKAKNNHMIQILLYMKAKAIKHGFVMYENKNTQEYLVIPVEYTPENEAKLETVLDWLRKVRKTWEDKTLPKRPFRLYKGGLSKVCQGCPLSKVCWEDNEEGTVEVEKMTVPEF